MCLCVRVCALSRERRPAFVGFALRTGQKNLETETGDEGAPLLSSGEETARKVPNLTGYKRTPNRNP